MRSKVAKHLRHEASAEMSHDRVPDRDLVWGKNSVINSPQSVRAMYLKMKQAFVTRRRSTPEPQHIVVRERKRSGFYRPMDVTKKPALIQSPLKFIAQKFPATKTPDGGYEPSWQYTEANIYASVGHGGMVRLLAQRYA